MSKSLIRTAILVVAMLIAAPAVWAQEEKIALDKLPKEVSAAVKAKFPKAKFVGAGKEKEGDKTVYEVTIKDGTHSIDVTVTPEGKIMLVEKEIPAKDLPKAVSDALEAKYPKATIKLAEEISKDDKITKYEMVIVTSDKKDLEVSFDPKGKFMNEEVKKKEEK